MLLVEADDDHARLVSAALAHELDDPMVARATSIAQAVELQNGFAWSVAVVAQELPDGSGVDVLDALRAASPAPARRHAHRQRLGGDGRGVPPRRVRLRRQGERRTRRLRHASVDW